MIIHNSGDDDLDGFCGKKKRRRSLLGKSLMVLSIPLNFWLLKLATGDTCPREIDTLNNIFEILLIFSPSVFFIVGLILWTQNWAWSSQPDNMLRDFPALVGLILLLIVALIFFTSPIAGAHLPCYPPPTTIESVI